MEIIVKGTGKREFAPETILIIISFSHQEKTYEKCLENGAKMVETFINDVLTPLEINKEEMKTDRFYINEVTRYIPEKSKSIFDGYCYNQNSRLVIDYDIKKMIKFMELVAELKNPPSYRTTFGLKNEDEKRTEVIADAIAMAKKKATIISRASDKELVDLVKVDFKPFDTLTGGNSYSNSVINSSDLRYSGAFMEETSRDMSVKMTSSVIKNAFTPNNIEIAETVYCLYVAK